MAGPYRKFKNLTDRSATDPINGTLNGPWIRDIIFGPDEVPRSPKPLLNRSQRHDPRRGLNQRLDEIPGHEVHPRHYSVPWVLFYSL